MQERILMSDLNKYINKRKERDLEFAKDFDSGYEEFKIGEILKQARLDAGLTQEDVAIMLKTDVTIKRKNRISPKLQN